MSIATRAEFGFAGIIKLRAKIIDKIGCKNAFFLVKEALKILLN
jgi:hypothetical protein